MAVLNKRVHGVPPGAVYVGRPSKWGNPFTVQAHGRAGALSLYRQWLMDPEQAVLRELAKRDLAGRDLVCWCAPEACHAELLHELANAGTVAGREPDEECEPDRWCDVCGHHWPADDPCPFH